MITQLGMRVSKLHNPVGKHERSMNLKEIRQMDDGYVQLSLWSEKRCYRCGISHPTCLFHKASNSPSGLQDYCKKCRHEYDRSRNDAKTVARRSVMSAKDLFRTWGYMRPTEQFGLTMRRPVSAGHGYLPLQREAVG
jgi:hypothetical protein